MADSKKYFYGFIFIMGGGTYANGETPEEAAKATADQCRKDWSIPKTHPLEVNVYDLSEFDDGDDFYFDYSGVYADEDHRIRLDRHSLITMGGSAHGNKE